MSVLNYQSLQLICNALYKLSGNPEEYMDDINNFIIELFKDVDNSISDKDIFNKITKYVTKNACEYISNESRFIAITIICNIVDKYKN